MSMYEYANDLVWVCGWRRGATVTMWTSDANMCYTHICHFVNKFKIYKHTKFVRKWMETNFTHIHKFIHSYCRQYLNMNSSMTDKNIKKIQIKNVERPLMPIFAHISEKNYHTERIQFNYYLIWSNQQKFPQYMQWIFDDFVFFSVFALCYSITINKLQYLLKKY